MPWWAQENTEKKYVETSTIKKKPYFKLLSSTRDEAMRKEK